MSRTWKNRKGYKTHKRVKHSTYQNHTRGSYEDYDHSDQEMYVYDQCCDNWTIVKKVDRELEGVKSFSRIGQAIKGY